MKKETKETIETIEMVVGATFVVGCFVNLIYKNRKFNKDFDKNMKDRVEKISKLREKCKQN